MNTNIVAVHCGCVQEALKLIGTTEEADDLPESTLQDSDMARIDSVLAQEVGAGLLCPCRPRARGSSAGWSARGGRQGCPVEEEEEEEEEGKGCRVSMLHLQSDCVPLGVCQVSGASWASHVQATSWLGPSRLVHARRHLHQPTRIHAKPLLQHFATNPLLPPHLCIGAPPVTRAAGAEARPCHQAAG